MQPLVGCVKKKYVYPEIEYIIRTYQIAGLVARCVCICIVWLYLGYMWVSGFGGGREI